MTARIRSTVRATATVALVAAMVAAATVPAHALATTRIAGADRFATSVEVSRATPTAGGTVFLASGLGFADALSAGPVAAAEGGHLLLTRPDRVPDAVIAEIDRLAPHEIVLVGSRSTISDAVRTQLRSVFGAALDPTITRIGGADRVATSLLLLDRLRQPPTGEPPSEVWIVSGSSFPDALVAASVAGTVGGAVILDWHGAGSAAAAAWADRVAPYVEGVPTRIAGGTPSVSAADAALLSSRGALDLRRFAGADRYATAIAIHDAYSRSVPSGEMLVATGERFPDALSGAVLAAATSTPLYLSPRSCSTRVTPQLAREAAQRGIDTVIGLGSAASLSDRALALGSC